MICNLTRITHDMITAVLQNTQLVSSPYIRYLIQYKPILQKIYLYKNPITPCKFPPHNDRAMYNPSLPSHFATQDPYPISHYSSAQ